MSYAIEVMMEEHQYILRALQVARKMSKNILDKRELETEDFYKLIDFVRNFADKYHHQKEETILFKLMEDDIGEMATEGPIKGMLIEHDLGRLYMSRLDEALKKYSEGDVDSRLEIIANTISYTQLLEHHITTEDNTLYPFAQKKLGAETLEKLQAEVKKVNEDQKNKLTREKYIAIIEELENKYGN